MVEDTRGIVVKRAGRTFDGHRRRWPATTGYTARACASDDDSLAMVDLMLDDLRGETGERGMALAEFAVEVRHLDTLVAHGMAFSLKGKASFGGVERTVSRGDLRVEHDADTAAEILVHEGDDSLGNADHVRGHADAAIAVSFERVFEVLGHGEVLIRVPRILGRSLQKRDGCHDCSLHVLLSSLRDDCPIVRTACSVYRL